MFEWKNGTRRAEGSPVSAVCGAGARTARGAPPRAVEAGGGARGGAVGGGGRVRRGVVGVRPREAADVATREDIDGGGRLRPEGPVDDGDGDRHGRVADREH